MKKAILTTDIIQKDEFLNRNKLIWNIFNKRHDVLSKKNEYRRWLQRGEGKTTTSRLSAINAERCVQHLLSERLRLSA